jgi:calcium-dependent protein kinase
MIRAVKIVEKSEKSSKFVEETDILKTIDHPNIVKICEIFEDLKSYYIVTEFCEGNKVFLD